MPEGSFSSRDPWELDTVAAASFVTLPGSARYFLPFLASERAAAEVARELGVDTGSVTYRIRQMLKLRLIEPTRRVPRAGRAIQYYRSTADSVFAPLELTPISTVQELFRRARAESTSDLEASLEKAWLSMGREQRWGTHLYRPTPDAAVNRDFVPRTLTTPADFWTAVLHESAPAVWDQHATLHLSRETAKDLQRDMSELVARYGKAQTSSSSEEPTDHLIYLAMAPASW